MIESASKTSRMTPTARNQNAALTALTFQYRLVKGPGRNVPVAQAMKQQDEAKGKKHVL